MNLRSSDQCDVYCFIILTWLVQFSYKYWLNSQKSVRLLKDEPITIILTIKNVPCHHVIEESIHAVFADRVQIFRLKSESLQLNPKDGCLFVFENQMKREIYFEFDNRLQTVAEAAKKNKKSVIKSSITKNTEGYNSKNTVWKLQNIFISCLYLYWYVASQMSDFSINFQTFNLSNIWYRTTLNVIISPPYQDVSYRTWRIICKITLM